MLSGIGTGNGPRWTWGAFSGCAGEKPEAAAPVGSRGSSVSFLDGCVAIDKPDIETGSWWLDAELQGRLVVVEWRADRGFGITTPPRDDFGTRPHEVYETAEAAYDRVVELLLSQTQTIPGLTLRKLRELRGLPQTEIAWRLQINQGAVSRLERRGDMLTGTLRNLVSAMGGRLKLIAEFPDRCVDIQIHQLLNGDAR